MLYNAYEMQRSLMSGASAMASVWSEVLSNPANPLSALGVGQVAASALDVFAHAAMPRGKPSFAIDSVEVEGESYSRYGIDCHAAPFRQSPAL
jgi:poly(3-hydroxybutyrate) depolymerase